MIDAYDEQIEAVEEKIEQEGLESTVAQRLLSIPGVSQYTTAVVVADVGEINRSDTVRQLVSYAGLDLMIHQSGNKEIHGEISKEGSAP